MCDTFAVPPSRTADGGMLFAKNSDRRPNEPHAVLRTYPIDYPAGAQLECTYICIPQAAHTYACLLCKPSWIWGCEMGANEWGLHIGNEAVFTKEPVLGDEALTGMDLARLALERCVTAREAADLIIALLARHGQGGNCGYDGQFFYHNSFLIADSAEIYILETAGAYWALKRARDVVAISNCLTLENDYDEIHADAVDHAIEKKWCKNRADFGFASCYGDALKTRVGCGNLRRNAVLDALCGRQKLTPEDMAKTLRLHREHSNPFGRGSGADVCMHAGARIGTSHTTGSLIAEIGSGFSTEFVTGSSTPCLSLFKPYWMQVGNTQLVYPLYAARAAREGWIWREHLHRLVLSGALSGEALEAYLSRRDRLESRAFAVARTAQISHPPAQTLAEVARHIVEDEVTLLLDTYAVADYVSKKHPPGGPLHKLFWHNQNAHLGKRRPGEN